MKYWEIIADNLHDAGWSLGWVSAIDAQGRPIWIVDAHRGDGRRFSAPTKRSQRFSNLNQRFAPLLESNTGFPIGYL
jgi:hypothetical protein